MKFLIFISVFLLSFFFLLFTFSSAASNHHHSYFQQHVRYSISAKLDPDLKRIDAEQRLIYFNNSPDTLSEIYFHLYLNKYKGGAFQRGALNQTETGGIEIFKIRENDSSRANFSIDHTLLKLPLLQPLSPGDSIRLQFKFSSKLPPASDRYGYMADHFDVGNWYPTPVVYDRAGWHLHQHVDNEFYQEWADFRVDLRVPKGYVVGATGDLLNADSALQDTARAIREWRQSNYEDTTTTLWQFEAKMVHDFAWTADPQYILRQTQWQGITINVLSLQEDSLNWAPVNEWTERTLEFLSTHFGPYPYKQTTIADTYVKAGGIEYPQIVFINNSSGPDYSLNYFRAVIIHEIAHNWFYGLLANNQTEHEWLDEGFTTFAEIICLEALFGRKDNFSYNRNDWYSRHFYVENDARLDNALTYLWWSGAGKEKHPINIIPDYVGDEAYISQYSKMANVLFMLQSVLGDSVFSAAMKNYCQRWRFRHPAPQDFIAAMEETAGRDLDWFFDQWLKTTRQLDYSIDDVKQFRQNGASRAQITLSNRREIFMPLDLDVHLNSGRILKYQIPVDQFAKPEKDRTVLPYWHFTQKKYKAEITLSETLPEGNGDKKGNAESIDYVEIDPSLRLMDINRLNNRSGLIPPMQFVFMRPQSYAPPPDKYLWEGWPLLFYNDLDKLKAGFKLEGSYLKTDHQIQASGWIKTARQTLDYDLVYQHPVNWFGNGAFVRMRTYTLDGREGSQLSVSKQINAGSYSKPIYEYSLAVSNCHLFREAYCPDEWDRGNTTLLDLSWQRQRRSFWGNESRLALNYTNSVFNSDFNFKRVSAAGSVKFISLFSDFELSLNMLAGYIEGSAPRQHLYSLNGANGWQMFENPYYRSRGTLYYPWYRDGHLYMRQDAQVRGYGLYPDETQQLGNKALLCSGELILPNPFYGYIPFIENVLPSIFLDAGRVWNGAWPDFREIRTSAGVSLGWDRFYQLSYFIPIEKIQFDFPLRMSRVPNSEEKFDFRWLVRFDFDMD